MVDMITANFSKSEMACRCGECGRHDMDEEFMRKLQELRNVCGPLQISSGLRCEAHNKKTGGYPKSAHLQGRGADIRIYGPKALKVMEESRKIGFNGIGFSQKGEHKKRFIHLDTLEREAVWSY
jgi:zinc D-Ala-D-Ala carboxypeptidase